MLAPVEGVFSGQHFGTNGALMPWGAAVGATGDSFMVLNAASYATTNVTVAELAALPGANPAAAAASYLAVSLPEAWAGAAPSIRLVDAAAPLSVDPSATAPPGPGALPYGYWLLVPIGKSGWALLGELSKVVPASAQRIQSVTDQPGNPFSAVLVGAPGEVVTISAVDTAGSSVIVQSATCTLDAAGAGKVTAGAAGVWACA